MPKDKSKEVFIAIDDCLAKDAEYMVIHRPICTGKLTPEMKKYMHSWVKHAAQSDCDNIDLEKKYSQALAVIEKCKAALEAANYDRKDEILALISRFEADVTGGGE